MGAVHAYLFEAKGVQRYLFASGRLRDVVGASDLVARLAQSDGDDLIGSIIAAAQPDLAVVIAVGPDSPATDVSFSRRAGAVFCLHCSSRETLVALRRAVRERVMLALPGLEIADALTDERNEAVDEIASLKAVRNNAGGFRANMAATVLPMGRPVMRIAPQTGMPCVEEKTYGKDSVALDCLTSPQRKWADVLRDRMIDGSRQGSNRFIIDGVAKRFHPEQPPEGATIAYPRRFESDDGKDDDQALLEGNPLFPLRDRGGALGIDNRIALVHADLSGLGEGFANFYPTSAAQALAKGAEIEAAVLRIVRAANARWILTNLKPGAVSVAPARPIVIGGDDMTFIVRADLALPFAAYLLDLIEQSTGGIMGDDPLSACAGIAIVNRKMPFLTANALAESLCKHAKKKAKEGGKSGAWPSLMSFHVQNQTAEEDYARDIVDTLKSPDGRMLTANPYAANPRSAGLTETVEFAHLKALAGAIYDMSGGFAAIRKIRGELANGRLGVARGLWRRIMGRSSISPTQEAKREDFKRTLAKVTKADVVSTDIPDTGALFDALALIDIAKQVVEDAI